MSDGKGRNGRAAPKMGDVPGVQGGLEAPALPPGRPAAWVRPRTQSGPALALEANDPEFARRYPALHEYLTLTRLEGQARETSTMLVFCEDSRFKACLHDREGAVVLFRASSTFLGLLEALEACLVDGSADWREKKGQSRPR